MKISAEDTNYHGYSRNVDGQVFGREGVDKRCIKGHREEGKKYDNSVRCRGTIFRGIGSLYTVFEVLPSLTGKWRPAR